ncbi:MAG: iron-containing alcohol dehydrogenase [Actinomycetota bacterium]|nr:iron-containing alcohol dehydrogenase [Actinomycetota bacterium]
MRPPEINPSVPFLWEDGDRTVHYGRGALGRAAERLEPGYALLSTPRARAVTPALVDRAGSVHDVAAGRVDEVAGDLRPQVSGDRLVALGGGRVIDVGKALAAADPPRRIAAVPTTLSAAEMTSLHRQAAGVPGDTPHVRPTIVINDPALSASQPEPVLAASALNALSHAVEAPLTTRANPVATLAAHGGAWLLARAFDGPTPDRDALALGALLAGYAADAAGYGLHHVMSQTLARVAGVGHASANAIMLPHTTRALARRAPAEMEQLATAAGEDLESAAGRLAARAGPLRLRERGVTAEMLGDCADAALRRAELGLTPPAADRAELLAIYEAAW